MSELLLEIHSDEIPARMQAGAKRNLHKMLEAALSERVSPSVSVSVHVTPNRLCALASGLPRFTRGEVEERRGPRVGAPDKAVAGFARSAGVNAQALETRTVSSGNYYFAVVKKPGVPVSDVVREIVPDIIRSFPWPKSMRWGQGKLRWVRPVNSILCIIHDADDSKTIDFEVDGIRAGNWTRGHRLMSPGKFSVRSFDEYRSLLRNASVMLDADERLDSLRSQVKALASRSGLEVVEDNSLLGENAGLVEWPVVSLGEIDRRYSELPPEILVSTIRTHLKFISLRRPGTEQITHFASVANRVAKDGNRTILEGNIRVLNARLGDAEFAWENDLRSFTGKDAIQRMKGELSRITFHNELGSLGQRVDRIQGLAEKIGGVVGADTDEIGEAASFIKLDLLSDTVGEFPELQGVIGRHLATKLGLGTHVSQACEEHHLPAGPDDRVPVEPTAVSLAVADRLDQISGFFGIGLAPTGSKDPYALRRAALGVIRLVLANRLRLPIEQLLLESVRQLQNQEVPGFAAGSQPPEDLVKVALGFVHERLVNFLDRDGLRPDVVSACIASPSADDLYLVELKSRALQSFLAVPGNEFLVQGYRRANNILRGVPESETGKSGACQPGLFRQEEEKLLHSEQQRVARAVAECLEDGNADGAIDAMSRLVSPINRFFEDVRVNTEDEGLRRNRLSLLEDVRRSISSYADLSCIEI